MVNLFKESQAKYPREAVHDVLKKSMGGIQPVALGQSPRNRQQAKDLQRNRSMPQIKYSCLKNISGPGKSNDPWYCLLNESKLQARDKSTTFVRDVRVGPEPLCVMASERQLHDLHRFCCNLHQFKPLTVDPTFNIGESNVTPISHQRLVVETKQTKKYPTLIGPVLVHKKKTQES